jgi:transcriptional regulator with XRE-family HTH domain
MTETFGHYIRNLRKTKGYTLTHLGAMLGVDSGALSKIETGKKMLDEHRLPQLCEVFGLDKKDVQDEYYSEMIAKLLYEKQCSDNVLTLAEVKVKYIKSKNTKQSNLNFKQ